MARVKRGTTVRRRHNKILKLAKGYRGGKSRLFRVANQQVMKSLNYAYVHRKLKKRDFRKLWIARINAAVRNEGMTYSRFMEGLTKAGVAVNRKMLSEIAIADSEGFKTLIEKARAALA